jgi:hypothetical protein
MITFPTSQIQNVDLSHGSSIPHDDARANARLRSQLVHRSSLHKADTYARSALFMRGNGWCRGDAFRPATDRISAVTLPDPARAIRDDHHDLEHFEQS